VEFIIDILYYCNEHQIEVFMSVRGTTIDTRTINRDDIIYLSGLIDGDGCFFISKRRQLTINGYDSYMMKLQVHCIEESLINWIVQTFGGVKVVHKKNNGRRTLYGAEFTGNRLTTLCELLIPFLKLKKPHAENMLQMRRTFNGLGGRISVPKHIQHTRESCFQLSRQINSHKPLNNPSALSSFCLSSEEVQVN
jgi:LAGLIDADG endonuclease